jgi:propionate CoA-transferase
LFSIVHDFRRATVGLGTFLDPRRGRGSAVTPNATNDYISADGDALIYRLPLIEVCLFNAPYADSEGNIYFRDAATITENFPGAAAARRNGGLVMAAVSSIVPKDEGTISLRAEQVDCIVVNPRNEQTGSVPQRRFWPMFTVGAQVDEADAVERLKFANKVLRITPVRSAADDALARLAAALFVRVVPRRVALSTWASASPKKWRASSSARGWATATPSPPRRASTAGCPRRASSLRAAINPTRMEPSSWMFDLYAERLAVAVLGFLQVDAAGNVNVSKRGPRMMDYVGPGGFPDIAAGARTVIFVGSWMAGALSLRWTRARCRSSSAASPSSSARWTRSP